MLIRQGDSLHLRLMLKKCVDISDKTHEINFLHTHLHLSLIDLTQIHHLVNQMENTFRISFDRLIDTFLSEISFLFQQRQQWSHNQCHRSPNLMTDIHKEA